MIFRCVHEAEHTCVVFRHPHGGNVADQHLVAHAREAVDVGPLVEIATTGSLLGAHVAGGSQGKACTGEVSDSRAEDRLGDSEVGDDRVPVGQKNVLRLDVPVHHAFAMSVAEGVCNLTHEAQRMGQLQSFLAVQKTPQRLTLDVRHHGVQHAVGVA